MAQSQTRADSARASITRSDFTASIGSGRASRFSRTAAASSSIMLTICFPPPFEPADDHTEAIIARTRARYTRPRAKVEAEVNRFIARPMPLS